MADFAIDGRCLLLGPATPSFQRRLDALNALADPGGQTFAGLPTGARLRVRDSRQNKARFRARAGGPGRPDFAGLLAGARSQLCSRKRS